MTLPIRRGDIYTVDLEPVRGSEQGKVRPALVIQNDVGNRLCLRFELIGPHCLQPGLGGRIDDGQPTVDNQRGAGDKRGLL